RRMASMPTTTAYRKTTTRTPASSTVLSELPKVEVAKSLSQSGVRSIAASPTATTGDAAGMVTPAKSWAMPIAAAAVSRPQAAPHQRDTAVLDVMHYGPSESARVTRSTRWLHNELHDHATWPV